mmetsp:Transcript_23281/g.51112  ORF Transcript_23281/g.51112 Transcript_23281/m.51112 type:complete len:378 (+) Transcript_23281:138-1271(+)
MCLVVELGHHDGLNLGGHVAQELDAAVVQAEFGLEGQQRVRVEGSDLLTLGRSDGLREGHAPGRRVGLVGAVVEVRHHGGLDVNGETGQLFDALVIQAPFCLKLVQVHIRLVDLGEGSLHAAAATASAASAAAATASLCHVHVHIHVHVHAAVAVASAPHVSLRSHHVAASREALVDLFGEGLASGRGVGLMGVVLELGHHGLLHLDRHARQETQATVVQTPLLAEVLEAGAEGALPSDGGVARLQRLHHAPLLLHVRSHVRLRRSEATHVAHAAAHVAHHSHAVSAHAAAHVSHAAASHTAAAPAHVAAHVPAHVPAHALGLGLHNGLDKGRAPSRDVGLFGSMIESLQDKCADLGRGGQKHFLTSIIHTPFLLEC